MAESPPLWRVHVHGPVVSAPIENFTSDALFWSNFSTEWREDATDRKDRRAQAFLHLLQRAASTCRTKNREDGFEKRGVLKSSPLA